MTKRMLLIILVVALTAVFFINTGNVFAQGEKKLKFAYICKMLTHPWFIAEEKGIKAKCAELGID